MNRAQRRNISQDKERIDITGIVVQFSSGQAVNLDIRKVMVIDKLTKRPLFEEVLEPTTPQQEFSGEPNSEDGQSYTVEFDTPEGKMEFVKKGNWSGVRPIK